MNELTIIKQGGGAYIDSREVAELIGKRHDNLLRDIDGYRKTLEKSNLLKIEGVTFFIKSSYTDAKGEGRPCYLLSKMGCEMVANKLTGEKGILFTASYVAKFNEMEQRERAAPKTPAAMLAPRLGEYNVCARIVVRGLKYLGATPEQVFDFLKGVYEPLGIAVGFTAPDKIIPRWYRAHDIAEKCGIYSLSGRPHNQAVASILGEIIFIGKEHKRMDTEYYGDYAGVSVRYDDYALKAVKEWIAENSYPDEIYGFERTYRVQYFLE